MDLTDTQINSHVSLQGLTLQPKETTQKDIGRFCRLKELAEGQKDLESALEFKAQEIKTVSNLSPNPLVWLLTFSFWLLSNFGRSVSLPCLSLGSVWLGFALWYAEVSAEDKIWYRTVDFIMECIQGQRCTDLLRQSNARFTSQ